MTDRPAGVGRRGWGRAVALVVLCGLAGNGAASSSIEGEGRVVAVDTAGGSVTLEHGPLSGLAPPGRTRFPVRQGDVLEGLEVGDRVSFSLDPADETHGLLVLARLVRRQHPSETGAGAGSRRMLLWGLGGLAAASVLLAGVAGARLWQVRRSLRAALAAAAARQRATEQALASLVETLGEVAALVRSEYPRELRRVRGAVDAALGGAGPMGHRPSRVSARVVVRRGQTALFQSLRESFETPGVAQVAWDRRSEERRTARAPRREERRRADRRRPPAATWVSPGFVVAWSGTPAEPSGRAVTPPRAPAPPVASSAPSA